jgi:acyl-CoA thioester hydrolase, YbgC/YbaW family
MIVSETNLEVRYYETDLMGIVHHSNYIRYFECGRHKMLEDIGMPIQEIEKRGFMIPVISVKCTYKTPAKMGDILRIVTKIEELPLVKILVKAQIYNSNNEIVAFGEVGLGVIHSDSRKPTRVPQFFIDVMNKYF